MKKTKIIFALLVLFFISNYTSGQVTIGDNKIPEDYSILELNTKNTKGGLRLPQLTNEQSETLATKLASIIDANRKQETAGLLIYNSSDNVLQYWDTDKWIQVVSSWKIINSILGSASEKDIYYKGTVSIGTDIANKSSILNISSPDKGVILPHVTLQAENSPAPISTDPADLTPGLLVFNSGNNKNFPTAGYMFWNGSSWRLLSDATTAPPTIKGSIISKSQKLNKNDYNAASIDDYLEINYTGGNGSHYSAGEKYLASSAAGKEIWLQLEPGKLESSGKLIYKITGKPGVPNSVAIDNIQIKFFDQTLGNISVGGKKIASVSQYTLRTEFEVPQGYNGSNGVEKGYGGTIMQWYRNGENVDKLILPETGAYVFSFRLYGSVNGNDGATPIYISAFKQVGSTPQNVIPSYNGNAKLIDTLLDIAELTALKINGYGYSTYSVNLTVSGEAGDIVYFKVASAYGGGFFKWTLKKGEGELTANRSSMIFWKI